MNLLNPLIDHNFKRFLLLLFLSAFSLLQFGTGQMQRQLFSSSTTQLNPMAARLCTFSDDATGFYASWHSNCSGLITFVLNVRNFPRQDYLFDGGFGGNLFRGDAAFGHYWTGIGIHLISTEMALVENLYGGIVSVTPARIEPGRPPQREPGGGILINPRGSFVGSILEATFSLDESLLRGCKQFTFFTAPTPVGAPYGGVPFSRTVCDIGQTCSRYQCGALAAAIGPTATGGDFFGGFGGLGSLGTFDRNLLSYSARNQQQPNFYNYNNFLREGQGQGQYSAPTGPYGLSGQFDPNNVGLPPPGAGIDSRGYAGKDEKRGSAGSLRTPLTHKRDQQQAETILMNSGNELLRSRRQSGPSAAGYRPAAAQSNQSPSQFGFSTLVGTAYEGQDRLFQRTEAIMPVANRQYEQLEEWRRMRGEQRDRWRPIDQGGTNGTQMYWPWRTTIGQQQRDTMAEAGGAGQGQPNGQQSFSQPPTVNSAVSDDFFFDPAKCDGGVDPQWCADYVRQSANGLGQQQTGEHIAEADPRVLCSWLRESLRNSDHRCCNVLQRMGC